MSCVSVMGNGRGLSWLGATMHQRMVLVGVAASFFCAACGSSSAGTSTTSEGSEASESGGEAEEGEGESERERHAMRLGCDTMGRRELRRAARRIEAEAPISARERAVVREHVIQALARWYELGVADEEVDRALVMVREQNGLTQSAFEAALDAQGLDLESYGEQLRTQILMTKVVTTGLSRLGGISPEEIGEADVRRFLREAQDRLEDVPTEGRGRRCVERWPTVAISNLRFEGAEGVELAELVGAAEEAAGDESAIPIGPDGRFPAAVEDAWRSLFFERGYLQVRFELPEPEEEGALVELTTGPRFRLGEVRVGFVRSDGTPIEDAALTEFAAGWPAELQRGEDGVFRRSAVGVWAQGIEERVRERWATRAALVPQIEVGEGDEPVANVGLLVVLADDVAPPRPAGAEADDEDDEE